MKFVAFPEAEFTFSMRGPPPPQGQGNPVTGTLVDDFGSYPHAIFGLSGLWLKDFVFIICIYHYLHINLHTNTS